MSIFRKPLLTNIPPSIAALHDYQPLAQARLSEAAWAYFSGGAADQKAVQRNASSFDRYEILPQVLNNLTDGNTSLGLLGCNMPYPILLAPVAFQRMAHADGELATVLAASAMRTTMVLSMQSSCDLQEVAAQGHSPLWFQWYNQHDKVASKSLLKRVEQAGYAAIVMTVDAPVSGIRNQEQRVQFQLPDGISAVNLQSFRQPAINTGAPGSSPLFGSGLLNTAATWHDLTTLINSTNLPVIVKGILRPQDAEKAVSLGAQAIIVSNHGGRTLDAVVTPLRMLPHIYSAIGNVVPLLLDGGIRRGTDIFIALALGAKAVLIGRPYIYALAAAGAPGVAHVLHILRTELEVTMALAGCATLSEITPDLLLKAQ